MLIDTHAHLNFKAYKDDVDEAIKRSLNHNIEMINVGSGYETSKRAIEIAKGHKQGVYATVGLHPIHIQDEFNYEKYKELAQSSNKVVAIGEIGLDYKSEYLAFKEQQKKIFLEQLKLAQELRLPIIFHCRMAHNDLIQELQAMNYKPEGVVHCFTGNKEQAKQYLKMGLYLGFNGIIFNLNLDEVIAKTPLEKILLETDCPFLTPPQEGDKRNEPIYLKYIAEKIAQIKKIDYLEVTKTTSENAKKLFKI